jgi:DNA-binding response OmpR family regulator
MPKRILIVDDEADFVQLVLYRLQAAGFEVEFAVRGMEAINKARLAAPDLIVLDLRLPDVDGLTVCEILRRQPGTRRTPVIMVTAAETGLARVAGGQPGVRLLLKKPVDFPRLLDAVRTLAARPRSEGEPSEDHEPTRG